MSNLDIILGNPEDLDNDGELTLNNCSVSVAFNSGIYNSSAGTLTVLSSDIYYSGGYGANGGGIYNAGVAKIANSSIEQNETQLFGAGIYNSGTLTLAASSILTNTVFVPSPYKFGDGGGGGIYNAGTLATSNSLVANNTISYQAYEPDSLYDDCSGVDCLINGQNGNVVEDLTTPTSPGDASICGGLLADIPNGTTTDQRGVPRTTTYSTASGNLTCVDSGAIQTHYSLTFSTEPPATVVQNAPFSVTIQLSESGILTPSMYPISLALGEGDNGTLSNSNGFTNTPFSNLMVSEPGSGDTLVAAVTVTTNPPPPPLVKPLSIGATSIPFSVIAPGFSVDTSATQLSLAAGQTGQLTITIAPFGGYKGAIGLSTGAPQNATCALTPATVTADGSNTSIMSTLTVTTVGKSMGTVGMILPSGDRSMLLASLVGLPTCLASLTLRCRRRRSIASRLLCLIVVMAGVGLSAGIVGCGGGSSGSHSTTSDLSVTANGAGNISKSITITLTVTQ